MRYSQVDDGQKGTMKTYAARPASTMCKAFICPGLVFLAMSLSACVSGPPPTRYLLEPLATTAMDTNTTELDAIGLATLVVPGYVKDNSIARRGIGATLVFDESSQWAEDPDVSLTRTLAESLRLQTGADVLVEPLPRGFEPHVRVEVVLDRLLAESGGVADMSGQVRLISGDGRDLLSVFPFRLLQRGRSDGYDGFFDAIAIGMDDLSRLIVAAVKPRPS